MSDETVPTNGMEDAPYERERDIPPPAPESPSSMTKAGPRPIGELAASAFDVMFRRASKKDRPIATPWPAVNVAMRGGFWPGLYTLTSASGMGKTQWALQCALGAARDFAENARIAREELKRQGLPEDQVVEDRVIYVALELGDVDLVARVLGLMAGTMWSDFFFGKNAHSLTNAVAQHQHEMQKLPLHVEIADAIGWTYLDLLALAEKHRPKLLVLDYAQLVSAPPLKREELRHTIGAVAKVGRDVARRFGVAVLVLCSTARINYGHVDGASASHDDKEKGSKNKAPPLGDGDAARLIGLGKESGELEFTADCVLALARERTSQDVDERRTWLAIAKGRGFPTGWIALKWDGSMYLEAEDQPSKPLAF